MGKRDKKKKDPQKKALQRAAKEAKQDKKAAKKLAKEQRKEGRGEATATAGGGGDEDDIDAILASYAKRNVELTTPVIEVLGEGDDGANANAGAGNSKFPTPPRGNFTLTAIPSGELVMFGGEFYDGAENVVFDELLRWDPDAKSGDDDDNDEGHADQDSGVGGVVNDVLMMDISGKQQNGDQEQTNSSSTSRPNPGVWKRVLSPPPIPPARCSHTAVYYNNALYVFGGELATAEKYHHYKDLWKFDLKTNMWTEISPRGGHAPPSRSGHRCIVWRHYMIMFGGFYEALRETRWYNDLWVYDFSTSAWTEMTYSKLATVPAARSAFSFSLSPAGDTAFVYGGYSKLKNPAPGTKSEARVHNDCWALQLKGIASGRIPTWDRVSRKGEYPSLRSGTSCVTHKSRMLVFGGVSDEEQGHHTLRSVFYDDLFAFDMDRRGWFKMGLKKASQGGGRRRKRKDTDGGGEAQLKEGGDVMKNSGEGKNESDDDDDDDEMVTAAEGEAASSGWDQDRLRANMFAFIDGDGNVVYERIEESDDEEDDDRREHKKKKSSAVTASEDKDEAMQTADALPTSIGEEGGGSEMDVVEEEKTTSNESAIKENASKAVMQLIPRGAISTSEVMAINDDSGVPEAVAREEPLPRIHAAIAVMGSTLYIYGGLLEVGDREVTLDDCWSIDLNRREKWICLWPGSMHKQVWRGVNEDDESYISTGVDDSDDDDEEDEWMLNEAIFEEEGDGTEGEAAKGEEKRKKRKEKTRDKIARLREEYDLDDLERTPELGESMADFYSRTAKYWEGKAIEVVRAAAESKGNTANSSGELSTKELKREGFNMARERYGELKPVLDGLMDLEAHKREKGKQKQSRKVGSKKDKKKKDRKK